MECKKCSWKWEIEKDDTNPYLCHCCGYDSELNRYDIPNLKKWQSENLPFKEMETNEGMVRIFESNINELELTWHRDNQDRIIESVGDTNWMIQLDNELPKKIDKVFIPKGVYHRLIKGDGDLKVNIVINN